MAKTATKKKTAGNRATVSSENKAGGTSQSSSPDTANQGTASEQPLPASDQLRSPQQDRLDNNPTGTRADGTTARHTEPLGPAAPGQRGVPGPERRVRPQNSMMANEHPDAVGDTPEEIAAYKATLGPVMRVKATQTGFYDNARRRAGDVFDIREKEYSDRWMEPVDGSTPKRTTSNKQALKRHHDKTLAQRAGIDTGDGEASVKSSGDTNVI